MSGRIYRSPQPYGNSERALRLAGALWRFWSERGHPGEGRRWLREAMAATAGATSAAPTAREKALTGAATLAAEALCAEALPLFRTLNDTGRMAETLSTLGIAAQFQDENARASPP